MYLWTIICVLIGCYLKHLLGSLHNIFILAFMLYWLLEELFCLCLFMKWKDGDDLGMVGILRHGYIYYGYTLESP